MFRVVSVAVVSDRMVSLLRNENGAFLKPQQSEKWRRHFDFDTASFKLQIKLISYLEKAEETRAKKLSKFWAGENMNHTAKFAWISTVWRN